MVFPFLLAIIPAITSAITAITTAVATVGPAIAAYAAKIGPAIIKMAHTAGPVLTRVVEVANVVAPALQVFNKGETVESIGERSLQAAEEGIIPEQFEDFDEYMEKIRNFPLDNNKAEHRKTTIPEASIVAGLGISTLGLENKFELQEGSLDGLWLLPVGADGYFTPERIEGLLNSGQLNSDLLGYLNKTLTASDARNFEKNLSKDMNEDEQDEFYQGIDASAEMLTEINKITE